MFMCDSRDALVGKVSLTFRTLKSYLPCPIPPSHQRWSVTVFAIQNVSPM